MKIILPLLIAGATSGWAELQVRVAEGTARIFDGARLVSAYRTDSRVPYLYPLLSPSGANVTRHWPMSDAYPEEERDHPHHRSLWLAHGPVNGCDFWAFHDDSRAQILHRRFLDHGRQEDGSVEFAVELRWRARDKDHLSEERRYRFRKEGDATYVLQVESVLQPVAGEVLFGDSKEGFFALRVDRTLRSRGPQAKSRILNSAGDVDDEAWGKRAKWIAYHGPDERGQAAVVALFDHPANLRYPTWWHARDYGLAAANPFGIHDFEGKKDASLGNHLLKEGETLRFRYQVILHHGDLQSAELERREREFAGRHGAAAEPPR